MELVDLYNGQKELTNETVEKKNVPDGKFRLSVHVWITNGKGELLVQQRLATAHKFPNMWAVTGGAVKAGESSLDGVLRELSEELGIKANKDEMKFIASYRRKFDYVDVWLLNKNIDKFIVIATKHDYTLPDDIRSICNLDDIIIVRPNTIFNKYDTLRFEKEFCKKIYYEGYEIGKNLNISM